MPDVLAVRTGREYFMPVAHHDALPDAILPFDRSGVLFGEPPPDPLVPYPIVAAEPPTILTLPDRSLH